MADNNGPAGLADFVLKMIALIVICFCVDRVAGCEEYGQTEQRIGYEARMRTAEATHKVNLIWQRERAERREGR